MARFSLKALWYAALLGVAWMAPAQAQATPRYALVVGMNQGRLGPSRLPPLRYAEREAAAVRDALVRHSRFEGERIQLVTGGGRAAVMAGLAKLKAARDRDRKIYGAVDSMFVFYFTGHGRDGQLLTGGTPVSSADIESIKTIMGATLMVAVLDTCESAKAVPKGAIAGSNPLETLPDHVVDASGTVWIASSSRGEFALEDDRGAIFTHHFLNAFRRARGTGVGRSLVDMFEYARAATQRDAERLDHRQTPRIRLNIERTSPLYLSFHKRRPSKLHFQAAVEGTFIISYGDGMLVERLDKRSGRPHTIASYAGRVKVYRVKGATDYPYAEFQLAPGQQAVISHRAAGAAPRGFTPGLRVKGEVGLEVALKDPADVSEVRLGLGYGFVGALSGLLGAQHHVRLRTTLELEDARVGFSLGYGYGQEVFAAWGYRTDLGELAVEAGYVFFRAATELSLEAGISAFYVSQTFDDGATRGAFGGVGRLGLRWSIPLPAQDPDVVLDLSAGVAFRLAPSIAQGSDGLAVAPEPYMGLGLLIPLRL